MGAITLITLGWVICEVKRGATLTHTLFLINSLSLFPVCVLLELGKICHIIAAEFRCLLTYDTLLYFANHTTSPSPHVQTTLQAPLSPCANM